MIPGPVGCGIPALLVRGSWSCSRPYRRLVPGPISSPVGHLVPVPYGSQPVPVQSPSVPAPAARGSRFSRPSGSRSRSQVPSSTRLISAWSSSEWSRASSHRSSSSLWSQNLSWLRSRPRSPARVQVSFLSVAPFHVKSSSPLESVPSLYSSPASYHRCSPLVAPPLLVPIPILLC